MTHFLGRPQRKLERMDSIIDNEAILEDENLLTPEDSPTHEWETIETFVFNGNETTFIPKYVEPGTSLIDGEEGFRKIFKLFSVNKYGKTALQLTVAVPTKLRISS